MTRIYTGIAALAVLAACGGSSNPFTSTTGGGTTGSGGIEVPAAIANDLDSLNYDAANRTLTVSGLTQDGVPLVNTYNFVSEGQQVLTTSTGQSYTAYINGYTTFTAQNDPLGRHATAFVASREGVQAGVVLTGGQFGDFFGGTFYERTGTYTAPVAPEGRFDVTYHGTYAAGLNGPGPVTDLLPINPALDPDVNTPNQAAYVRGLIFVNVDLNDMSVEGEIYNRTAVFQSGVVSPVPGDAPDDVQFAALPDIFLVEGTLEDDGSFAGVTDDDDGEIDTNGTFAGVIGGPNGESMVGGTSLTDFVDQLDNEIEYGVFVLDLCQAGDTDPICLNAQP
ncbi:hypothetical protein [Ascidiaceihabitans sp.]|uniref:hypothetical protein n=1 Tax=Ascidiaceihabitans sp. TaxID=1872644 RepID=UPI003296EBC3